MDDIFNEIEYHFKKGYPSPKAMQWLKDHHWQNSTVPYRSQRDARLHRIAYLLFVEEKTLDEVALSVGLSRDYVRGMKTFPLSVGVRTHRNCTATPQ